MAAVSDGDLEGPNVSQDEELDLACDLGAPSSFLTE